MRRVLLTFVAFTVPPLAGLIAAAGLASAQTAPLRWGIESVGHGLAMARSGNTIYVGGTFMNACPLSGGGVLVTPDSGRALPGPLVAGSVYVALQDGAGGWFIAG